MASNDDGLEGQTQAMQAQWKSIWDISCERWAQKPRYYASRLLNYAILTGLPRRVGDVLEAVGGDVERLYNIAVNSPNVDRISREVFLSEAIVSSHIDGRRFDAEERYLPRRPRHEEYLLNKPAQPLHYLPVGTGSNDDDPRLQYFGRMAIPYGVHKRSGRPVALDYRDNLLLDRELPQIKVEADKLYRRGQLNLPPDYEGDPSKLGEIFNAKALLWNVFRSLMKADGGLQYFLAAQTLNPEKSTIGGDERISAAWFWGMNDRGSEFVPMIQASDSLGEPAGLRAIPDLLLLGINHFYLVEASFASTFFTCTYLAHERCPGTDACHYWTSEGGFRNHIPRFDKKEDVRRTCGRHFQLSRLYLMLKAMSTNPSMRDGRLVCIIDEEGETGELNAKLFSNFVRQLQPQERHHLLLTSWQKVARAIPVIDEFEDLHREFREKWLFR